MDNRYVAAAEFKANCLRLMDEVAGQRRPIIITKRGKPVAKLVPVEQEPIDLFGHMAGTAKICGDIIRPRMRGGRAMARTSEPRPLLLRSGVYPQNSLHHRDCFATLAMTPRVLSLRGAERRSNLDVKI
jgi:prevent-host-death family protein